MYINKCTELLNCTLPEIEENFSNLCTVKHKYTLVDITQLNDNKQAL